MLFNALTVQGDSMIFALKERVGNRQYPNIFFTNNPYIKNRDHKKEVMVTVQKVDDIIYVGIPNRVFSFGQAHGYIKDKFNELDDKERRLYQIVCGELAKNERV